MEINRGTTFGSGRIMVEQCKSDNYETSYITFFNRRVHLFDVACYDDKGSYDYKEVTEIEVDSLGEIT